MTAQTKELLVELLEDRIDIVRRVMVHCKGEDTTVLEMRLATCEKALIELAK